MKQRRHPDNRYIEEKRSFVGHAAIPANATNVECSSDTAVFKKLSTFLGWSPGRKEGFMTSDDKTLFTVSKNIQLAKIGHKLICPSPSFQITERNQNIKSDKKKRPVPFMPFLIFFSAEADVTQTAACC